MTRYLIAAALAALTLGAAAIRGWLQRRATARAEATAERLRAEGVSVTAEKPNAPDCSEAIAAPLTGRGGKAAGHYPTRASTMPEAAP